jgi:rare lipoprotein A
MNKNVYKSGPPRTSAARNMRFGLMALALSITGSGIASTVPKADSKPATSAKRSRPGIQIGKASWYGKLFNGRKTASGERFNMNALTCAHRSLPLGSWVRVTNLSNMKSIFVRVNDRGPVPRSRIMDLSYAAARRLGMDGLAKVSVERMRSNDPQIAGAMLPENLSMQMLQVDTTPSGVPILPTLIAER